VIFHLFDNNMYFAAQPDGSRTLKVRDNTDMKYHVPGNLEMADHSVIKTLANISAPLLRAGGSGSLGKRRLVLRRMFGRGSIYCKHRQRRWCAPGGGDKRSRRYVRRPHQGPPIP
jgi:hypothetical protein